MVSFDDGTCTCSFLVTHGADRESAVMQFVYMYYVPKILSTAVLINFALRGSKGKKKKKGMPLCTEKQARAAVNF